MGYCELGTFYMKLLCILFGQRLEKIGLLFTPTSSHTVRNSIIELLTLLPRPAGRLAGWLHLVKVQREFLIMPDNCFSDRKKDARGIENGGGCPINGWAGKGS